MIALDVLFIALLLPLAFTYVALEIYSVIPGLAAQRNVATIKMAYNICVFLSSFNFTFAFPINLKFNKVFYQESIAVLRDLKNWIQVNVF